MKLHNFLSEEHSITLANAHLFSIWTTLSQRNEEVTSFSSGNFSLPMNNICSANMNKQHLVTINIGHLLLLRNVTKCCNDATHQENEPSLVHRQGPKSFQLPHTWLPLPESTVVINVKLCPNQPYSEKLVSMLTFLVGACI